MKTEMLRKDILTETFLDVEKLIYSVVWEFHSKHGGTIEELIAEAYWMFIVAFDSYQPSKAKFTTWLKIRIDKGLMSFHRKKLKEVKTFYPLPPSLSIKDVRPFIELLDEVCKDSQTIIQLVLDLPKDLYPEINGTPQKIKKEVRQILTDRGWKAGRISECFQEIERIVNV